MTRKNINIKTHTAKSVSLDRGATNHRVKTIGATSSPVIGTLVGGYGAKTLAVNPYRDYSWSYACIKAISTACSGVPLKVYNTKDEVVDDTNDPFVKLFARPNPLMVGTQFWKFLSIYYENYGQVFIVPRDKDYNKPVEVGQIPETLELVDPKYMTPRIDNFKLVGWQCNRGGSNIEQLSLGQVVRFFELDPTDILKALPPSSPARTSIQSDMKAHTYNETFFENGGQIQGVLIAKGDQFEDLTTPEIDEIRSDWDGRFSGTQGAHRTPVLTAGLEYVRTGASQKDMDFKEMQILLREEVLGAYGVPKTKLGLTDSVDRAVAKVFDKQFYQDNIMPKLRDWAQVLNCSLLAKTNYKVKFDASGIEALNEDSEIKLKNAKVLQELGYPLNQINELLDLGLDEVMQGWANDAIDTRVQQQVVDEDEVDDEADAEPKKKKRLRYARPSETDKRRQSKEGESESKAVALSKLSDAKFLEQFHKRVLEGTNFKSMVMTMTKYFSSLQKTQLALLSGMKDFEGLTKASSSDFVFNSSEWDKKLVDDVRDNIETAFEESAKFLEDEVGGFVGFEFGTDKGIKAMMKTKLIKIKGINKTIRESIRKAIGDGITNNETVQQITERVRGQFDNARARALTIARTEIGQSAGACRHIAMDTERLDKLWLDACDKVVRSTHSEHHMKGVKPMNYEYAKGLKYPCDMACDIAEEIINCRCCNRAVRKKTQE